MIFYVVQPQNLKLVKVESFQIDVAWEPPAQDYYGISHYLVEYRSKFIVDFVQVSAIPTLKNYECKLTGMEPDVLYKIRIFAEKDKGKGDPTDLIKCRTPKVGKSLNCRISKNISEDIILARLISFKLCIAKNFSRLDKMCFII